MSMRRFVQTHRDVLLIFLFAYIVRLSVFAIAPDHLLTTYALGADGSDYVREAHNILNGHGFSRSYSEPYVPDALRTPLYPLALAGAHALFGNVQALLFIQVLLSSLIPGIVMGVARYMISRTWVVWLIGCIVALEPHMVFYTTFYASEGLALIFLYLGIASLMRWFYSGANTQMTISGAAFGLSTLVRPAMFYVHLILIPSLFVQRKWGKGRAWGKSLALFTIIFLAVLSPWIIRNEIYFGTPGMSTVGWFNMYTRVAATTLSIETGKDFYTSYQILLDELSVRGYIQHEPPVSEREIEDPRFGPILKQESLRVFKEHPRAFAMFVLSAPFSILTQDNTLGLAQALTGVHVERPPFSPTLYVSQHGLFEGARALAPYLGGLYVIPFVMRAVWGVMFLFSLVGVYALWKKDHRFAACFFLLLIGYVVLFTMNAGAQIDARYRLQSLFGEVILAAAGLEYILDFRRKRI